MVLWRLLLQSLQVIMHKNSGTTEGQQHALHLDRQDGNGGPRCAFKADTLVSARHRANAVEECSGHACVQGTRLMGRLYLYMLIWVRDGVRPVQLHNHVCGLRLQQLRQNCLTSGLWPAKTINSARSISWMAWHGTGTASKLPKTCRLS